MALGDVKGRWRFTANSITASNALTLNTGSAVVAKGDLIVVVVGEQTALTATGVTDTLGNTYSAVNAGTDAGAVSGRAFYTVVTNDGTNTNITVAATASVDNTAMVAGSFEGSFTTIDVTPANNNNTDNASPFTCPATGTLAQALEFVIAWMVGGGTAATWSATSPLIKTDQVASSTLVNTILGGKVVNSTSTTSPEFTGTNPTSSTQGTTSFKAANLPENQYDWPISIWPPYNAQLRTWIWTQQLTEEVAAQAPFAQTDWPLTPWPPYSAQLRTWTFSQQIEAPTPPPEDSQPRAPHFSPPWSLKGFITDVPYNLALYAVKVEVPFNQIDWPIYRELPPIARTWTWNYNLNLIGQDFLPPGERIFDLAPKGYEFHIQLRTWIASPRPVVIGLPFNQSDWPLYQPLPPAARSWTASYNLNLIGQDRLPIRQMDWPLPQAPYRSPELVSWIDRVKLLLAVPFKQTDWPNNLGPLQPNRSFATVFPRTLIGQDKLPVGTDYTDRPQIDPIAARTWIQSVNLALTTALKPFNQTDWPNTLGHIQFNRSFATVFPRVLVGKDQLPVGVEITDLPPREAQRAIQLRTWIYNTSLALQAGPGPKPHKQTEWPLPIPPFRLQQSWTASYNRNLIGKDKLPPGDNVTDLSPRAAQRPLTIFVKSAFPPTIPLVKRPFNQYNWPIPLITPYREYGLTARGHSLQIPPPPTELPNIEGPIVRDWWDRDEWGRFIPGAGYHR